MNKDAVIGVGIRAASIIVIAVYLWLIFLPPLAGVDLLVLKLTGSVAVAAVFGILAKGEESRESDVDILVEFETRKSLLDLAGLKIELEENLGRKVDVLTY